MVAADIRAGKWAPRALSVLRIVTAFLFMLHGSAKLLQLPDTGDYVHLQLFSLIGFAGMLELAGGLLVLIGLFTRPVAFILSGEMAFAYFMAHAPRSFFPVVNQGDAAVLFCFIFLYLAFAGGGPWGIDAWRRRAKSAGAIADGGAQRAFAGPKSG
jgi:putative oxidoreductase